MGVKARRDAAREVVKAAAEELGIDPLAPPLPKFAAGEEALAAAVRVLKLTRAEKALRDYRVRRDALEQVIQRYAELSHRRRQLALIERGRIHDQVTAGRVPEPAPQKARDELAAILLELELIGPEPLEHVYPFQPDTAVYEHAIEPDEWLAVVLYLHLTRERLLMLTENEKPRSHARAQAEGAAVLANRYEQTANSRMGADAGMQKHYVAVRAVRLAVEVADLNRVHERQERERSIEELAAASAAESV